MATDPVLLSRYSQDIGFDTRMVARYIGSLEEGRSKVSVNSTLSIRDRDDFFRFRVTGDEFLRISTGELAGEDGTGEVVAKDGSVRYQILSPSGVVMADSDPESPNHDAWLDLTSGTNLKLSRGSYTIRVSRGPAAVDTSEYIYSFTLKSGLGEITDDAPETALREFLTTERPAPPGAVFDQFASVTAVLGLFTDVRIF